MAITLPTQPVVAQEVDPRCLVLYGPPKIGKSSINLALPSYLLIDTEDGSEYLSGFKVKINDLFDFNGLEDLIKKANKPYEFGILDTADGFELMCEKEATRRYKASTIGSTFKGETVLNLPNGGGYLHLRNVFYEYFHRFKQMFKYCILTGHVRDKNLGTEGKEVAAKDLDLTGKVRNIACAYADAIGYCFRDKQGIFNISFVTNDMTNCGTRAEHLRGQTFKFDSKATLENWKQIYKHIK